MLILSALTWYQRVDPAATPVWDSVPPLGVRPPAIAGCHGPVGLVAQLTWLPEAPGVGLGDHCRWAYHPPPGRGQVHEEVKSTGGAGAALVSLGGVPIAWIAPRDARVSRAGTATRTMITAKTAVVAYTMATRATRPMGMTSAAGGTNSTLDPSACCLAGCLTAGLV